MTRALIRSTTIVTGAVIALTVLSGCNTPAVPVVTPTPEAVTDSPSAAPEAPTTRPSLDELVLSTEGLGTLLIGQPPVTDEALSMIYISPNYCTIENGFDTGLAPGDPEAVRWLAHPSYEVLVTPTQAGSAFFAQVDAAAGNAVRRIELVTTDIPTDKGIRLGDQREDVVAAYADAVVTEFDLTDVYTVTGPTGLLLFEVVSRDTPDADSYWGSVGDADGLVRGIRAVDMSRGTFQTAGSGDTGLSCS